MFKVRKITLITLIFFVITSIILISCSSSPNGTDKAPLWVSDIGAVYPDAEYLAAVGYAQDRSSAEAMAVSNLSKILKQKVESESSATQKFENNLTEQSRAYETTVKTSSLIDSITGLKIQETWTSSDNTTYALALINRKETGSFYSQKIVENENAINSLLNFMIDNEATFESVSAAEKALVIANESEPYLELLSVIHPSMYKGLDLAYKSAQAVSILLQLEKEKIYIGVYITGDVDRRITNALSVAFKNSGYKSESLASFTNPSTEMPYVMYGELIISPFAMTSSQNNEYVRFTLNTELVDINGKTFFPWGLNGREAHLTEAEAAQRALRTLEDKIIKDFYREFQQHLK